MTSNIASKEMLNELLKRCKNNDRRAQKIVYEYLFGRMFGLSMRYAESEENAGEILNSAFYKVFTNLNSYRGEGNFENWVKSIVVRTALDFIRQNKSYKEWIKIDNESDSELINEYELDYIDTEELLAMISKLPNVTRTVFNMVAIDGYKHKEVAEMLGISDKATRWHLHSARSKLIKLIEEKKDLSDIVKNG